MTKQFTLKTKYLDQAVEIYPATYANGQLALELLDPETGERVVMATVAVGNKLPSGCVAIKNYSENEGMLEALIAAGLVKAPVDWIRSGFVAIPVCPLVEGALEEGE